MKDTMSVQEMLTEIDGLLDDAIGLATRESLEVTNDERSLTGALISHLRSVQTLFQTGTCSIAAEPVQLAT